MSNMLATELVLRSKMSMIASSLNIARHVYHDLLPWQSKAKSSYSLYLQVRRAELTDLADKGPAGKTLGVTSSRVKARAAACGHAAIAVPAAMASCMERLVLYDCLQTSGEAGVFSP